MVSILVKKPIAILQRPALGLALGAAVLFGHVQAEAFVLEGVRWPGSHPRVPFYVSTNWAGHVYNRSLEDGIRAITNAANVWNTQGASNLKFFYAGTTAVTNAANDGINAIIYDPGECTAVPGCVAQCIYFNGADTNLDGFDIILYGKFANGLPIYWSGGTYADVWEMDTWSIVLHELGHAAGLDHSDIIQAVMGSAPANGGMKRSFMFDDIQGIQAIYSPYTNEGIWASNPTPSPGETVTLFLDYPLAAGQQYQIIADFDGLMTGCALREKWLADSRIFPLDRCPYPIGSQTPTPQEAMVLPANTGVLNGSGQAQVTVQIPESFSCFPTNRKWYFSVVTYDPNLTPSGIEDVGVAVALDIQALPGPQLLVRHTGLPGSGQAELRWATRANCAYQMEHSAALTNWTTFGALLAAPPGGGWLTGMVSLAQSSEFFRVQALAPTNPPCSNGVLSIVVSTNHLRVPEGGTASLTVQLSGPPGGGGFQVEIARTGGDTGLQLIGDTDHIFHDADWNVPVTFTISATPDADAINGVATFTLTGNHGLSSVTVTVEEIDDDP
jgi:hypothetical protein